MANNGDGDEPSEPTPDVPKEDDEDEETILWQMAVVELVQDWNEEGFPVVVHFGEEEDGKTLLKEIHNLQAVTAAGVVQQKRIADALEALALQHAGAPFSDIAKRNTQKRKRENKS